jgi:chemotaxis signal transduction protein
VKEGAGMKAVVTFSVGHYRFCISAHEVKAFIAAPAIRRLPVDEGGVEGVFDYHGEVLTAVSLRRKLGLPDISGESDAWIISGVPSVPVAFHVDTVTDVIPADAVQWRPVEGLPVHLINRFALHEKKIFPFITLKTLLAMPNISERDEDGAKIHPVEIEAVKSVKPDSGVIIEAMNNDRTAEIQKLQHDPMRSAANVSRVAFPDTRDRPPIGTQKNNDASHRSLTSVSRKNRFAADSKPTYRCPRKKGNHQSVSAMKTDYRRIATDNRSTGPISSDDSGADVIAVHRGFGWMSGLGLAAVFIFLSVYVWFHFWVKGTNVSSTAFPLVKEEPGLADRSSDPGARTGISPRKRPVDGRWGETSFPFGNSAKTGQTGKPAPQDAPATPSAKRSKQAVMMSPDKTGGYDDEENITPDQPVEKVEVLRVATKQYTVTVERSQAAPAEPRTEGVPPVISHNHIIHVVVKGDTLWDVSKRHLNDPFRYSELAALSNISDPHWIYPGDVIRIIKNEQTD